MLHSTLPRAFLAPGLSYFAGYYGDQIHPYTTPPYMTLGAEEPYSRIEDPRVLSSWEVNSRSSTPCPLDLSLKPPAPPSSPRIDEGESIEVDDGEDRKSREEIQRQLDVQRNRYSLLLENEEELVVDDVESHHPSSSIPSPGYDLLRKEDVPMECQRSDDPIRSPYLMESPQHKYQQLQHQKLVLTSPSRLQSIQNYQQQLLLTPQHQLQGLHSPMTPPSTPSPPQCPRRKLRDEDAVSPCSTTPKQTNPEKQVVPRPKKKHARKLKFDEDTSSPVSGTVILGPDEAVVTGDIDPAFNIVEVTDEARAELAKIENRLGPYQCKLCRQLHNDAFQLAQHRCSRIAHVEYRCPECDKRFSCPANLASHRRWHKPRVPSGEVGSSNTSLTASSVEVPCTRCDAKFTRQAALRKHMATQHPEMLHNNNNSCSINNNESNGLLEAVKPMICSPVQLGTSPLAVELP